MIDLDHGREIVGALRANPARTALTAFGVFWGLFMLVLLLGSGNGLDNGVSRDFSGGASNTVYVWSQRTSKPHRGLPTGRSPALSDEDTAALRAAVTEAEAFVPRHQLGGFGGGNNVVRGTRSGGFGVVGDGPEAHRIDGVRVTAGRFLNPLDLAERRKVAVIGNRVAEVLFAPGEDPVGGLIRIQGVYFQVIGLAESRRGGEDAERDAQRIWVPFTTFQRAFQRGNQVGWYAVLPRPGVPAAEVEEKVLTLLRARHQVAPDDARAFGHWNTEEEYLRLQGLFRGIRVLVWIVGIGTLSAGVIGVSNIMLVIVKERTRELGIRRAIGATPLWIAGDIVLESLLLTALAGYLGLFAGIGALAAVRALLPPSPTAMFVNPDVTVASTLLALAILVASGLVAGLLPARRALAMRTAEALRAE
jgi:putative ABC transport system permease protein